MKRDNELRELIKQGTHLLQSIKALDEEIAYATDDATRYHLTKAQKALQIEFNEVFDKVFGGDEA